MTMEPNETIFPSDARRSGELNMGALIRDLFACTASDNDIQTILDEGKTTSREKARFIHADRMIAKRD